MPTDTTPFVIQVEPHLYLDSENTFHGKPPEGVKVYQLAGGMLSLSATVKGQVLSGTLAVLPAKDKPGWENTLRDIGMDEDSLKFLGTSAAIISGIVSIVGWIQAAAKLLELLGIGGGPSLEELVTRILEKTKAIQEMIPHVQRSGVLLAIESSLAVIKAKSINCNGKAEKLKDEGFAALLSLAERRELRKDMSNYAEETLEEILKLLSPSRWELLWLNRHYSTTWGGRTSTEEIEVKNPDWWHWRRPVQLQKLADDGVTWEDASYPSGNQPRFDYQAALPATTHGILLYLSILKAAEPEYRSTGYQREALLEIASGIDKLMKNMRTVLLRTKHDVAQFSSTYIEPGRVVMIPLLGEALTPSGTVPLLGSELYPALALPTYYWHVGAIDLCAHTDTHLNRLGSAAGSSPTSRRLGNFDFDWRPPVLQLHWTDPPAPESIWTGYWQVANAAECARAAEEQSQADFFVLLQSSGYFQLAQIHATLKHLASDPDRSETVSGNTSPVRRRVNSWKVAVESYPGLFCGPIIGNGKRDEYRCETTFRIATQQPDRVRRVPTRFVLVALSKPWNAPDSRVLSEVELNPNSGPEVTLPAVETFDFFVEHVLIGEESWTPSLPQLDTMKDRPYVVPHRAGASQRQTAPPEGEIMAAIKATMRGALPGPDRYTAGINLPAGSVRSRKSESATFDVVFSPKVSETDPGAWIRLASRPGQRNADNVYVVAEETLSSGKALRTYFQLDLWTQITYLSPLFFKAEQDCLAKTAQVCDLIEDYYEVYPTEQPKPPRGVSIPVEMLLDRAARVRRAVPEVVAQIPVVRTSEVNPNLDPGE